MGRKSRSKWRARAGRYVGKTTPGIVAHYNQLFAGRRRAFARALAWLRAL